MSNCIESDTARDEFLDQIREVVKQAVEHAVDSGLVDPGTAQSLGDTVAFGILCELDNCSFERHLYAIERDDGVQFAFLHDHYFEVKKNDNDKSTH